MLPSGGVLKVQRAQFCHVEGELHNKVYNNSSGLFRSDSASAACQDVSFS